MKLFLDSYLCGGDVDEHVAVAVQGNGNVRQVVFFRNVKVL